jgi:hypothetical protein
MRKRLIATLLMLIAGLSLIRVLPAIAGGYGGPNLYQPQFVPNQKSFWDNSKNWTTNYGPAYRDTVEQPSQFLACDNQFALCFHSGPQPYPCTLSPDGSTAYCQCTVATETNYTLLTAILKYYVYQETLQTCGAGNSNCPNTGDAPVCKYLNHGALIPGADVISTFDPASLEALQEVIEEGPSAATECPKGPYAACMTAPCSLNPGGATATCKCPVFYGKFQLIGPGAECSLGGNLVNSAAYNPTLDSNPND